MNLKEAQTVCDKINGQFEGIKQTRSLHWDDVFNSQEEMLDALKSVYIPANRVAPIGTFIGYEFIYSFAFYLQKGWKLSDKQLKQCERLALEIKKAAAISEYKF